MSHRSHYFILAFIWASVHLFLFQHFGVRNFYDANVYINSADFLILRGQINDIPYIFYFAHIALLAASRIIFPQQVIPYLLFQCVLSGIATLSLYKASSNVFQSPLAGLVTGILYLMWWDNIQWNITIMTESLFSSLLCFIIYCLSKPRPSREWYIRLTLLLTALLFTRPTAIVIIASAVIYFIVRYRSTLIKTPFIRLSILVSIGLLLAIGAFVMFSLWDFTEQYRTGNIVTYMDTIKGSDLYSSDMVIDPVGVDFADESYHPIFKIIYFIFMNPVYFLKIAGLKVWYLITFTRPYYSTSHNLLSIIWIILIYTLSYFGFQRCKDRPLKLFVVSSVIINCLLIAISTIDWDNRFFIPMEAGLVLMAGGGASFVIASLKKTVLNFKN